MNESVLLLGIVLLPLFGALVNGLFGRRLGRQAVHFVAVSSVALAFVLALVAFKELVTLRGAGHEGASLSFTAYEWFSLGFRGRPLSIPVKFVMDSLSGVMTLVVTGIGLLIHIYSTGYMSEEKSFARFFAYLNLFTASMLILVLGSNLPLMFVGWEGVGVCSYLLIGFWFENRTYAAAGRKAFVANRIGDFGVLIGMFLLAVATGTFEFADINQVATSHPSVFTSALTLGPTGSPYLVISSVSLATAATLFLFLGCTGKSAQIPLYVWLPDAMAGPTPVSALIHAATMVTSGVYLICRLSPVFALAPVTMAIIAVTGALTALLGASIGLVQNEIKKVLAYSTVSQLGFMFAGVGCGAFAAGFMHVYTHAFFKACLFLGAGSVMHAVGAHGDADIRQLGGLRKYMPFTRATFLVSCLAIAGVPFFSGFFSKDEILVGALSASSYFTFAPWLGPMIFGALALGATMTAFYMFRLYFLTFSGEFRGGPKHEDEHHDHAQDDHGHHHAPHESPAAMTVPLVVLAIGAFAAGYVWIGLFHYQPWVEWLAPSLASLHIEHPPSAPWIALGAGLGAALAGIGAAWRFYYVGSDVPRRMAEQYRGLHALLMDKWRIDELYDATILGFSRFLARALAAFDKFVIDGLLSGVSSQTVKAASYVATRLQNGVVHAYGAVMAAGLLVVAFHFMLPHPKPSVASEPSDLTVEFAAAHGLAYSYRWDFDGDGEFDTEWSSEPRARHTFGEDELSNGLVIVLEPAEYGAAPRFKRFPVSTTFELTAADLGDYTGEAGAQAPEIVVEETTVVVRPRGARVRKDRELQKPDAEVRVARGEHVTIGDARLSVAARVRPVLAVRSVFGMERTRSLELMLPAFTPRARGEFVSLAGRNP